MAQGGVSVSLLRALSLSVGRLGGSEAAFLDELRISPETDDASYVETGRVADVIGGFASRIGEPHPGLALAQSTPFGNLTFVDYCAISSPNLEVAISRTARYYALLTTRTELALETRGDEAVVAQRAAIERAPIEQHITEFAFGIIFLRARVAIGPAFKLARVRFAHGGSDAAVHEAFFEAPVELGAGANEMSFDRQLLAHPMRTASGAVASALEEHAKKLYQRLAAAEDPFVDRVRSEVMTAIGNDPQLEQIAAKLRITSRTLQRRLAERTTTFSDLVDGVRREMATELVRRGELSLIEIAFELGFAEPATLYRAFRRWTGTTPQAYRTQSGA